MTELSGSVGPDAEGLLANLRREGTPERVHVMELFLDGGVSYRVEKLALTMAQVEEHQPPPNPAKLSDRRAAKFIAKYGRQSWEVDALPPGVLRQIIEVRFEQLLDLDAMAAVKVQEQKDIRRLTEIVRAGRKE